MTFLNARRFGKRFKKYTQGAHAGTLMGKLHFGE